MLSVKRRGIKYHFFKSLVWRDLGLNPESPAIGEHSTHQAIRLSLSLSLYIYIYIYIYNIYHLVVPSAWITLIFSRHLSLSFIASGRSSGLHPISSLNCRMYVRAGRPAFARPCEGVYRSTSLMSSSLLFQQSLSLSLYIYIYIYILLVHRNIYIYMHQQYATRGQF